MSQFLSSALREANPAAYNERELSSRRHTTTHNRETQPWRDQSVRFQSAAARDMDHDDDDEFNEDDRNDHRYNRSILLDGTSMRGNDDGDEEDTLDDADFSQILRRSSARTTTTTAKARPVNKRKSHQINVAEPTQDNDEEEEKHTRPTRSRTSSSSSSSQVGIARKKAARESPTGKPVALSQSGSYDDDDDDEGDDHGEDAEEEYKPRPTRKLVRVPTLAPINRQTSYTLRGRNGSVRIQLNANAIEHPQAMGGDNDDDEAEEAEEEEDEDDGGDDGGAYFEDDRDDGQEDEDDEDADGPAFLPANVLVSESNQFAGLDSLNGDPAKEDLRVRLQCGSSRSLAAALKTAQSNGNPAYRRSKRLEKDHKKKTKRVHRILSGRVGDNSEDEDDTDDNGGARNNDGNEDDEEEDGVAARDNEYDPNTWEDSSDPDPEFCFLCRYSSIFAHNPYMEHMMDLINVKSANMSLEEVINNVYTYYNCMYFEAVGQVWHKSTIKKHLLSHAVFPKLLEKIFVTDQTTLMNRIRDNQVVRIDPDTNEHIIDLKQVRMWAEIGTRRTATMINMRRVGV
jgi:hypothetical protein